MGGPDGKVHSLDQTFKATQTFKAQDAGTIRYIKQVEGTGYLVTLAEDFSHEPTLKVWSLDQIEKKTSSPKCLSSVTVQNGRKQFPVSAFAVMQDLTQVAIAFANGAVTVVRGDFIHDRGTKQRTVFESEEPVTGLEFREANATSLYIATTSRISTLVIVGKGQGSPARTLDEHGCAVGCMTLDPQSNEIVIARDDGLHTYGPRGKVAFHAYEGAKKLLGVSKDYVLLVSPPQGNSLARSAPFKAFDTTQADELFNTSSFTILNTDSKFIAHSEALSSPISNLFSMWGDIFLFTLDGKVRVLP